MLTVFLSFRLYSWSSWSTAQYITMLVFHKALKLSLPDVFQALTEIRSRHSQHLCQLTFLRDCMQQSNTTQFTFITPVQLKKMNRGMFNEEDKYNDIDETDNGFPWPALKILLNMMGAV